MPRKKKFPYTNTRHAQRMKLRRQPESCDAREERLSRQSQRQRDSHQSESCDANDLQLSKQRQRQTESRQNETFGMNYEINKQLTYEVYFSL
ncbi:Hypothetical predicted protein [Octopus vulgaris]|uniref:Uncharacterized protein n=1 Tax=Octopus vulgaris TaxID=6645 RepID=A0AA36AHU0_OCTVU|nr:Hypothetical predicted protein [Octopus vulgaris]